MAHANKLLGQFDLVGIPGAPRGMPQIEVTFDIDANGIVNVSAKDKATGKEQQIRIQASGGLSEADIDKMVKDAEAHAAEDKKQRELVEAKNHADGLIHTTERTMTEAGDKVSAEDRAAVESAVQALKDVVTGEDAEAIKAKTEALAQVAMKLGEALYKAQPGDAAAGGPGPGAGDHPGGGPGAGHPGGGGHGSDKVVDADFEEVDDQKKRGSA
jgi:molecular chaperone DnaK